jgi:uncharacterized protein
MRYVIDGYNLLHAWGLAPRRGGGRRLERARLNLLDRLRHAGAAGVTVVFDAARAPPDAAAEHDYHGIRVRFVLEGTADDWIEDLIRREALPQQLTVISDDHRLRQAAERRRCRFQRCLDYVEELQRGGPSLPPPPPADGPGKPAAPSPEEARHWLEAFGEADEYGKGP